MRRVVVTGIGAVTPVGSSAQKSWDHILAGKSGIQKIQHFPVDDLSCRIAGLVPSVDKGGDFNPHDYVNPAELGRIDTFILYAIAAASQAIEDAGWKPQDVHEQERTGVMIGSGIGGLNKIYETSITLHETGPRRVSPFFIPSVLINLATGHVQIRYGFKGPNHATVTACSAGTHAIGDASRLIMFGDADVMVAGGAEAAICRLGMQGFAAARALSTKFNDTPEKASRPWDKNRDGFIMGEGAGILVLEEYEHAKKRGAKIYAEVVGYGLSGDAHHITSPAEDGDGAYRAMKAALRNASLSPDSIDYINAHGTSTGVGDVIEARAIRRAFGEHVTKCAISSTKSATGHLLGAAGGIEAVFSVLSLRDGVCPPTLNLDDVEEECADLNLVPHTAQKRQINYVMSNSFGFGGTNSSIIFKKVA